MINTEAADEIMGQDGHPGSGRILVGPDLICFGLSAQEMRKKDAVITGGAESAKIS